MDVIITEWGLQSYLDLKGTAFTDAEYRSVIRPDAELLKRAYPTDPRFSQSNFWSIATDKAGAKIADGYKMKWHNMGPGHVQLRLCVALLNGSAFLCHAYMKNSGSADRRNLAMLKTRIDLIRKNQYSYRGKLP